MKEALIEAFTAVDFLLSFTCCAGGHRLYALWDST